MSALPLLLLACGEPRPSPSQPTVILVVMDTVRADHLSLCGYGRPTSPVLDSLARREGARWTCDAYAPGSWTLPSHASFFTGLDVLDHGADTNDTGIGLLGGDLLIARPLSSDLDTIAERLAARGYQTLALAGNPLISEETGLSQGFERVVAAGFFGEYRGGKMVEAAARELDRLDPTRPLFLFINLADAHTPYSNTPAELPWLASTDRPEGAQWRAELFHFSIEDLPHREELAAWYRELYDYGVYRADQTLGLTLQEIERRGWLEGPHRLIITSDHGENLGERGFVDHGGDLYEETVKVPVLYLGNEPQEGDWQPPFPALSVYHMALGEPLPTLGPTAVAFPNPNKYRLSNHRLGYQTWAAIWSPGEKLFWRSGESFRAELHPGQGAGEPTPLSEEHPLRGALLELAERAEELGKRPVDLDPDLLDKLRAAGYVE